MVKVASPEALVIRPAVREEKPSLCGFCLNGSCRFCPRAVRGMGPTPKIWQCSCQRPECGGGSVLRCLDCKTETPGEIDPTLWACYDRDACKARIQKRMDANPALQLMREIKENAMAKAPVAPAKKTASRAPKEPRLCLVTGLPTSGGLFKPGMDARYVSETVADVVNKRVTVVEARKKLNTDGVSDALKAKFEKALALARERNATGKTAQPGPAARKAAAAAVAPAVKESAAAKRKRLAAEAAAAEAEDDEEDEDEVEEDGEDDF